MVFVLYALTQDRNNEITWVEPISPGADYEYYSTVCPALRDESRHILPGRCNQHPCRRIPVRIYKIRCRHPTASQHTCPGHAGPARSARVLSNRVRDVRADIGAQTFQFCSDFLGDIVHVNPFFQFCMIFIALRISGLGCKWSPTENVGHPLKSPGLSATGP